MIDRPRDERVDGQMDKTLSRDEMAHLKAQSCSDIINQHQVYVLLNSFLKKFAQEYAEYASVVTDVRRGTSGTSRDVPIFVP